jgi:butyryl-CoA dehydrogenase
MNELHAELIEQVKRFRLEKIEPTAEHDDANQEFKMDIYRGIGELGLAGIPISEEFGGTSLGYTELSLVLEELAKSSVSYAVTLSVSTMVQGMIQNSGTQEQKQKFLPSLTAGTGIGAFCLSEAGSGSDAKAMKSFAIKVDGGYELTGQKMWITSAGIAEVYVVMAKTGEKEVSSFIVPADSEGISFGEKEKKMGWKVSPTREVIFDKVFIPETNILGKQGDGFKVAMKALDGGRITIGSIAVGLGQRALDEAINYSLEREQFKQPIFDFQGIQFMLSDMATEVMSARLLVQESSRLYDAKTPNQTLFSMAKLKATDVAMRVTTDAVQVLGGNGYTTDYHVERYMRDAKVLQIVEGTNQIQRVVIARNLKQQYSE